MEAKRLEPGSPEAKVALLHHMINMCDGEIRLHAGRWRRYESTDVPTWAKLPQHTPQWSRIQLCGVPHVHRWGAGGPQASWVAPLLDLLEGQLLCLWTCACRWRCWDLLGEGSPDMDFAYDLWPPILPEAAVVCLGEPPHCCEKTQPRTTWWWSARSSRPHRGKDEDPEGDHGFPGTDAVAEANLGGGVAWRLIWREVGTLLAAKHFISHTPVPVMDLPVADVVDSKEQLRFRAMCDERISFPFEELRPFEEVYAKLEPYVQSSSYVEVKVAWRCNTEQWWWAEVDPAHAGPLYRKLNYSDEAIRAFGLDPDLPVGAPAVGAAAVGAGSSTKTPLLMEYPDQPRPPITVENVNSVMGKDSKKKVGGKEKHIFWAKTESGLVLSSVTPWEIISKEKGVTTGGYMCKHCQGFWKQGRGATRLVQIIGRNRGKKVSLQLIMDEPPEALYNQWIRDRIEYYKTPWAVGLGPPCGKAPSLPFQWSWPCRPNDLGVHPEQSGTFQPPVHRQGGRQACEKSQKLWGCNHCMRFSSVTRDCRWRCRGSVGTSFFIPIFFGWMCEGFSTADGVVVPPHNDEDHDWQWSFMIFPLGIDPSSACHCKKCWSDFTMAALIPWVIVSFLMPFCTAFFRCLFLFSWGGGFSFAIEIWRLCDWMILTCDVWCCVGLGWLGVALGLLVYWLKCLTMALLSQFKFPSPFTREEALETFNIGPFQADGELLCMCFLQPCDDPPRADGVGSRPWEAFRRVLEDLGEHSVETQSVIPSEQWIGWKSPFLSNRRCRLGTQPLANHGEGHLWEAILHLHTQRVYGWEHHDRDIWAISA